MVILHGGKEGGVATGAARLPQVEKLR